MGLTVHFEVLNQLGTPMLYSSTLATRPAAGITGRIFYRTDSPFGIYRDNGVTWDLISSVGSSGTVTGTGVATRVAYWDTTSSISSDAGLYFDVTNDRLGIATTTPGVALDAHQASGTIIQANATSLGNSLQSFQLQGTGKWQIGNVYNAGANYFRIYDQLNSVERIVQQNTGELNQLGWIVNTNTVTGITGTSTTQTPNNSFSNNFTFNSGISTVASANLIGVDVDNNLNYSGANTINQTSYNTDSLLRTIMTFGNAASTITYTQSTGIRALTNEQSIYIQSGANSGTISHYANLQIFGDQKLGAGLTTFTNRYQILLNDYAEFSAGNTYTNRWAIYQVGSSNNNYFAGKIITGSTTVSTYQLDVTGTTKLTGNTLITGSTTAVSNSAIGLSLTPTLVASANNDILSGLTISPTFTNGSFTGVTNYALLLNGNIKFNSTNFSISNSLGNSFLTYNSSYLTFNSASSGYGIRFLIQSASTYALNIFSSSNIGINTSTDIPSAQFQMQSTTQGFLPPVMTKTQRNAISSPASGLLVINSTDATLDGYDGTVSAWYQSIRSDNGYIKVNATTSGTASAASGQYLQINVNGTSYKLSLLNP